MSVCLRGGFRKVGGIVSVGVLLWSYGLVGLSCMRRYRQWEMVSFECWVCTSPG